MSYVIQRASRGVGAIASADYAPRRALGATPNALKSTSLRSIVTSARVASAPVIGKATSLAPAATITDSRTKVSAPIALLNAAGIPTSVTAPLLPQSSRATVLAPAAGANLFKKGATSPAPTRTTQTSPPTTSPMSNASVDPVDQACPPSYFLSGEKCVPNALAVNPGTSDAGLAPKGTSCPGGYYLDSGGWCRPIQQVDNTGVKVDTLEYANSQPITGGPGKYQPTPGGTAAPISYGGGGGAMYSPAAAAAQSAAEAATYGQPVSPSRSSGISLTSLLLLGGIGLGAYFLLKR